MSQVTRGKKPLGTADDVLAQPGSPWQRCTEESAMMRIQPELSEVTIVILGSLNPRIFTPDWFARHGLFSAKEADAASIEVVHAQITSFRTEWLSLNVQQDRFQATTAVAPYVRLSDLVVRTFKEFLPHTPLAKLGINRVVHFDVGSVEARDRIGAMLAPKEPWGDWAGLEGTR
jgi:hypothetical protein